MKRTSHLVISAVFAVFLLVSVWVFSVRAESRVENSVFQIADEKPVLGWSVCGDLGFGPVPGLPDSRWRLQMCHPDGWVLRVYCTQPQMPAPPQDRSCERIGTESFTCGDRWQRLREYLAEQTPVPTPTGTLPPSPTATTTPRVLPTRVRPGGDGILQRITGWLAPAQATPTPFLPFVTTPTPTIPGQPAASSPSIPPLAKQSSYHGIDFSDSQRWITIAIFPPDKRVNQGRPIVIKFKPGSTCEFGDQRACINRFFSPSSAQVTFLSIHSGLGGEAQAFRHAVESTGIDQAGLPLNKIKINLRRLAGAQVTINQGKRRITGFTLQAVGRVPAAGLKTYFQEPIDSAFIWAVQNIPGLKLSTNPEQPLLVFETCGWLVPGERGVARIYPTSASVYLGVIVKNP